MTLDEYQAKAQKTAIYPAFGGQGWVYPALGLAGEAGELANKLKKVIRDTNGKLTGEAKESLKGELGDSLWYVSQLARELGFSLQEVADSNIAKLAGRQKGGKIGGSGDDR